METNQEQIIFNRHTVYKCCLYAETQGINCGAFGNACDRSNRGEYKNPFYQEIAKRFQEEVDNYSEDELFEKYNTHKYKR